MKEAGQISELEAGVPQVSVGSLRTALRTALVGHIFWWGEATICSTAPQKGKGRGCWCRREKATAFKRVLRESLTVMESVWHLQKQQEHSSKIRTSDTEWVRRARIQGGCIREGLKTTVRPLVFMLWYAALRIVA